MVNGLRAKSIPAKESKISERVNIQQLNINIVKWGYHLSETNLTVCESQTQTAHKQCVYERWDEP